MGAVSAVSSILPVLSGVATSISALDRTVGLFNDITGRSSKQNIRQAQERQLLQQQQALQSAALQRQEYETKALHDENERRQALRRAVARQRNQFASNGIDGAGGSSEAVLLGLFQESEEERIKREQLDNLRHRALDADLSQQNSLNLLLATQLAEREKLQRFYI